MLTIEHVCWTKGGNRRQLEGLYLVNRCVTKWAELSIYTSDLTLMCALRGPYVHANRHNYI